MSRDTHSYMAHCVPGLEAVAADEIVVAYGQRTVRTLRNFDERTSVLVFPFAGAPHDLLSLNTVEDVFAVATEVQHVPPDRGGLSAVRAAVAGAATVVPAVQTALSVRAKRRGKTTFRVVARKAGEHSFRRVDLQRAVERGLMDRFPQWKLVEDDAQIEVWVSLMKRHALIGARLSDSRMRAREYRATSLPAALKPTVAHAMALLSDPREGDVVLDPMCGSGTILIERAHAARYRLLQGGDRSADAVQATLDNVGPKYKPIQIRQWDARNLPLENQSVSTIITNMPFGKQIGSTENNQALYPALIEEWVRVLMPGGRMVLLTGDRALLVRALDRRRNLTVVRSIPVLVRGYRASIVVIHEQAR